MSHPFKVIIAGAGVSGLALANMLEAYNIDYLLLESHSKIVTQVGASIGVLPNGLRILDQLGLYEKVLEVVSEGPFIHYSYVRDASGAPLWVSGGMSSHLGRRHGYQATFFDRKDLLRIMYQNIQREDCILASKDVCAVSLDDDGVTVVCKDGSEHRGTILVGADGIHSTVRTLTYELAQSLDPAYFDPQAWSKVPSFYRCHFGIAQHVPGWPMDEQHTVMGATHSQLIVPGPDGKVYWFLFERLPKARYGDDIPRYSKEDEAVFRDQHKDELVTETHRLGELFNCRIASTLTPLHEAVAEKWFFQRIMMVGDSVHKPNPINGQGGNAALETCAELANALDRLRTKHNGNLSSATLKNLTSAFSEVQNTRQKRAHLIVSRAHELQSVLAQEYPRLANFILRYVAPLMAGEGTFLQFKEMLEGASRLDKLPMPKRAHIIPWEDERPSKPVSSAASTIALIGFNATLAAVLLYSNLMGYRLPIELSLYELSQLLSPMLIWAVESQRIGNRGNILALSAVNPFLGLYFGFDLVAAVNASVSSIFPTNMPTGRPVGVNFAERLIPIMFAGYLLPLGTAFAGHIRGLNIPDISGYAPALFSSLMVVGLYSGKAVLRSTERFAKVKQPKMRGNPGHRFQDHLLASYENADQVPLTQAYKLALVVQAALYIAMMAKALQIETSASHSLSFDSTTCLDLIQLASNLYAIWGLRLTGLIGTTYSIRIGLAVGIAHIVLGPGATSAGTWLWRESIISTLGVQ